MKFLKNVNNSLFFIVFTFAACKEISIHLKCSDIFHCEIPNTYDMYGNCNGSCESGYFGEMCLERGNWQIVIVSFAELKFANRDTLVDMNKFTFIFLENKYLAELSNVSTTWNMELC